MDKKIIQQYHYEPLSSDEIPIAIGVDVCELERIEKIINQYEAKTLAYLFSDYEYNTCINSSSVILGFASAFAAKEAVGKALGTGLANIAWSNIELKYEIKTLSLQLYEEALKQASIQGIVDWSIWRYVINGHVIIGVAGYG